MLAGSGVEDLADCSVAHHMRLLTGVSDTGNIFYTHSPSEPILVLGSLDALYDQQAPHGHHLARALNTLSRKLCETGSVEKGILGELGARFLLLVARDFAAPVTDKKRDFLQPVRLLDFLSTLFGDKLWAGINKYEFDLAFCTAYVNFTHWIVTRDRLPEASPNPWAYMLYYPHPC